MKADNCFFFFTYEHRVGTQWLLTWIDVCITHSMNCNIFHGQIDRSNHEQWQKLSAQRLWEYLGKHIWQSSSLHIVPTSAAYLLPYHRLSSLATQIMRPAFASFRVRPCLVWEKVNIRIWCIYECVLFVFAYGSHTGELLCSVNASASYKTFCRIDFISFMAWIFLIINFISLVKSIVCVNWK